MNIVVSKPPCSSFIPRPQQHQHLPLVDVLLLLLLLVSDTQSSDLQGRPRPAWWLGAV